MKTLLAALLLSCLSHANKLDLDKHAKKHNIDRNYLSCSLKLSTGYKMKSVSNEWYGIGLLDISTIKAWGIDKDRLMNDLDYSVDKAAEYLKYIQMTNDDITLWPCAFRSKYNVRSSFCVDYMNKFNKCLNNKKGRL